MLKCTDVSIILDVAALSFSARLRLAFIVRFIPIGIRLELGFGIGIMAYIPIKIGLKRLL
jgi:hypothetical protein